jgi:hypothetical protein
LFILTKKNKNIFLCTCKILSQKNEEYYKKINSPALKVLPVKSSKKFQMQAAILNYTDLFSGASRKNITTQRSFSTFPNKKVIHFRE